tara:strand:+ start:8133 stop:9116 length:984 start_codon:yes stop_codon:yes gene_type:complete
MFKEKVLLITGGTGSFGNHVLRRVLETDIKEIRIFSRDEKKQDDMRKKYISEKLKFYIGDIRDYSAVNNVVRGVNYIFHAAALKQVPSCEFYPLEAVKTNILGTDNLLESAINNNVEKIVCLSTDKAVYPINAMGLSKAMMEKVIVAKARNSDTKICITRYGNVMNSRGSVIPLFVDQIKNKKPITITDPNMTRFMMTLEEAVELVMHAFQNIKSAEIFVKKAPAATIQTLSEAIKILLNVPDHPVKIIGTRHGEKLYESLLSREERLNSTENSNYFNVSPDLRDLNYGLFENIGTDNKYIEYTSHNTTRLDIDSLISLLKKIEPFK